MKTRVVDEIFKVGLKRIIEREKDFNLNNALVAEQRITIYPELERRFTCSNKIISKMYADIRYMAKTTYTPKNGKMIHPFNEWSPSCLPPSAFKTPPPFYLLTIRIKPAPHLFQPHPDCPDTTRTHFEFIRDELKRFFETYSYSCFMGMHFSIEYEDDHWIIVPHFHVIISRLGFDEENKFFVVIKEELLLKLNRFLMTLSGITFLPSHYGFVHVRKKYKKEPLSYIPYERMYKYIVKETFLRLNKTEEHPKRHVLTKKIKGGVETWYLKCPKKPSDKKAPKAKPVSLEVLFEKFRCSKTKLPRRLSIGLFDERTLNRIKRTHGEFNLSEEYKIALHRLKSEYSTMLKTMRSPDDLDSNLVAFAQAHPHAAHSVHIKEKKERKEFREKQLALAASKGLKDIYGHPFCWWTFSMTLKWLNAPLHAKKKRQHHQG